MAVLIVLISFTFSFGATTGPTPTYQDVWSSGNEMTYVYSDTTNSVAAGATEIFKIPVLNGQGKISEIKFESSSTVWTVFLSSVDSQTTPSSDTFIQFSGNGDTLYSPTLERPVTYYNGDTTKTKHLYLTISPTTGATGNWTLTITFMRY